MPQYRERNSSNISNEKSLKNSSENSTSEVVNGTDHSDCAKQGLAGYGCQSTTQHPSYRTTSKEYGWYAPDYHTAPSVYYPTQQRFSSYLYAAGMYRNHSLNTSMDTPRYK